MNVTDLTSFGWSEFFEINFKSYAARGYTAGRVALEHRNFFRVYTEYGEVLAEISGKLRHEAVNRSDLPAVGDWVVIRSRPERGRVMIHAVCRGGPVSRARLLVHALKNRLSARTLTRYSCLHRLIRISACAGSKGISLSRGRAAQIRSSF